MPEGTAFQSAVNGLVYLSGYVPDAILEDLETELLDMHDGAVTIAARALAV